MSTTPILIQLGDRWVNLPLAEVVAAIEAAANPPEPEPTP